MTEVNYNDIFQFPERCLLHKRITKKFFTKNFDLTAAEKKVLNNHVARMKWVASLKPANSNIPRYEDRHYLFEELQLITCTVSLEIEKVVKTIIDLFQKYIPYPILLVIEDENNFILNTSDKRNSSIDSNKQSIENHYTTTSINKENRRKPEKTFLSSISFALLNKTDLKTLHQGIADAIVQLKSSKLTGIYNLERAKQSAEDLKLLLQAEQIETKIAGLRIQLKKETQWNRCVELNMEIQNHKQLIKQIKNTLSQCL